MNFKITKRDILFFFIGLLAAFIMEVIVHWDNHVVAFGEGKKAAQENRR